tara:strand:+ start:2300 stop:2461 length:162 start_codon:yes stop_codon:yes gene_type:complete
MIRSVSLIKHKGVPVFRVLDDRLEPNGHDVYEINKDEIFYLIEDLLKILKDDS